MEKAIYFVSDAHLGTPEPQSRAREERLIQFLNFIKDKCSRLYMVGDIFDFWFEYRNVIPKDYHEVLFALKRLNELGVELHYVAGNHDFWLGDFLTRTIGINIHFKPLEITHDNKKFLILHGDGIASFDWGYRIMRKVLRFPLNIQLYRLIHPDLGIWLAKKVSGSSRLYTNWRLAKESVLEEYRKQAGKMLDKGYDIVVMAHKHSAEIKNFGDKVYANCGNWFWTFDYLCFQDGRMELKSFERD
jgi:UDP-2,3-diacylglucosamine hydrolase